MIRRKKVVVILVPDHKSLLSELELFGMNLSDDFNVFLVMSEFFIANKNLKLNYRLCFSNSFISYKYKQNIIFRILQKIFKGFSFFQYFHGIIKLVLLKSLYKSSLNIINEIKPNCVFCLNDRGDQIAQPFLKASKENDIKILIPYFSIYELNYSRRLRKEFLLGNHSSLFEKFYFNRYKHLLYNHKDYQISFYNVSDLFAYKKFNTLSKDPWWNGNNFADYICVDNNITKKDFIRLGKINSNKIKVVGNIVFDELFEKSKEKKKIKQAVIKDYGLRKRLPIVIIALPQHWEEGDNNFVLKDSLDEINFLLKEVKKKYCNVLVSLHPKMKLSDYKAIIQKHECQILKEKLIEVMAGADLFIASNSTTMMFSLLLGIKNISVCFNGISTFSIDSYNNINIVRNDKEFVDLIKKIDTMEFDFKQEWKSLGKNTIFDGNCISRYKKLIHSI